PQVHEPGAGDLRRRDDVAPFEGLHERLGDRARGLAGLLGEHHGHVRRQVTVLGALGAFDDVAGSAGDLLHPHGREGDAQRRADPVSEAHALSSLPLSDSSWVAFQRVSSSSRSGTLSATMPPPVKYSDSSPSRAPPCTVRMAIASSSRPSWPTQPNAPVYAPRRHGSSFAMTSM